MDVNELQSRYETLQDDYNEMCGAYKMRMAKYLDLEKKLNESYGMYAILKKQYNELQNSFEESQGELASANAVIMKYKEAHNHLVSIVSELKEELRQMRIKIDEVEEDRDNWKTVAIRKANELNDIEMRNLMREKPAQECCEHCNKIDCSDCALCPF